MRKHVLKLLVPALLTSLLLTGCSGVHQLLNPPPFTPPVQTTSPIRTALPTYVAPGSPIKSFELTSGQPQTVNFTSSSTGFSVRVTCPRFEGDSINLKATIQGANSSSTGACSTDPRAMLQLTIPNAVDGVGVPVKLTLDFTGKANTRAKVQIVNGANED